MERKVQNIAKVTNGLLTDVEWIIIIEEIDRICYA